MTVYLWFNKYNVDEENNKVMLNVLVSELFAFVLDVRRANQTSGVRIELDEHYLWSRLCRVRTQDGSIPHSDSEEVQSIREEDSSVNAAASTVSLSPRSNSPRSAAELLAAETLKARAGPCKEPPLSRIADPKSLVESSCRNVYTTFL
jgi:hypothetical protein